MKRKKSYDGQVEKLKKVQRGGVDSSANKSIKKSRSQDKASENQAREKRVEAKRQHQQKKVRAAKSVSSQQGIDNPSKVNN